MGAAAPSRFGTKPIVEGRVDEDAAMAATRPPAVGRRSARPLPRRRTATAASAMTVMLAMTATTIRLYRTSI
jgi:hypothetical protein